MAGLRPSGRSRRKWQAPLGRAGHLPRAQSRRAGVRRRPAQALRARHVPLPVGGGPARRAPARLHRHRHLLPLPAHAAAPTCCTPWASTPSACPPSSTPSRPGSIPGSPPSATSPTSSASCGPSASPTTGTGRFATTDPGYYRWTQWIFLRLFDSWFDPDAGPGSADRRPDRRAGARASAMAGGRPWSALDPAERRAFLDGQRLAYLDEVPVNWCPGLGTVLANEEVTREGRSERGDYPVYRRPLRQWMLRITAYADRLLDDLDLVDWPESIKAMQRNWIGRSEGAADSLPGGGLGPRSSRCSPPGPTPSSGPPTWCSPPSTRWWTPSIPDAWPTGTPEAWTGGATTPAAGGGRLPAPRPRPLRTGAAGGDQGARPGCSPGRYCVNPVNGARIPVFIADYVLMGYGTGAIMAVPGQDERDWEFAEHYDLPIVRTVQPPRISAGRPIVGDGPAINSGFLDGLGIAEAKRGHHRLARGARLAAAGDRLLQAARLAVQPAALLGRADPDPPRPRRRAAPAGRRRAAAAAARDRGLPARAPTDDRRCRAGAGAGPGRRGVASRS